MDPLHRRRRQRSFGRTIAVMAAASLIVLPGCAADGSDGGSAVAPSSAIVDRNLPYNDEDLHFAQSLAPHHDQAIEMSTLLLDKARVDPDVRVIAKRIKAVHQTQLDTINAWQWAQDRSAHDSDQDGTAHHGGEDGLLTEDQMEALDLAPGPEAEVLFLDGMIQHHEGALAMAEGEARTGQNVDAVSLAQAVIANHSTEIAALRGLRAER